MIVKKQFALVPFPSLQANIATARNFSSRLKILIIFLLRRLQRNVPIYMQRYFDIMMEGTVIEIDLRFSIRTLHDFFVISPLWEKNLEAAFMLKKGMIFLDVGAHIGGYTLRAAKMVGDEGRVIAVEPNKSNFEVLVRNIQQNGLTNCIWLNVAAYSANKEVTLFNGPDSAQHSVKENFGRGSYRVKARTLDSVLAEIGIKRPDLVKIDVEGAELEVLKGMEMTLAYENPTLIIEILKKDLRKVKDYLSRLAYDGELLNVNPFFGGGLVHYCFRKKNHVAPSQRARLVGAQAKAGGSRGIKGNSSRRSPTK